MAAHENLLRLSANTTINLDRILWINWKQNKDETATAEVVFEIGPDGRRVYTAEESAVLKKELNHWFSEKDKRPTLTATTVSY